MSSKPVHDARDSDVRHLSYRHRQQQSAVEEFPRELQRAFQHQIRSRATQHWFCSPTERLRRLSQLARESRCRVIDSCKPCSTQRLLHVPHADQQNERGARDGFVRCLPRSESLPAHEHQRARLSLRIQSCRPRRQGETRVCRLSPVDRWRGADASGQLTRGGRAFCYDALDDVSYLPQWKAILWW